MRGASAFFLFCLLWLPSCGVIIDGKVERYSKLVVNKSFRATSLDKSKEIAEELRPVLLGYTHEVSIQENKKELTKVWFGENEEAFERELYIIDSEENETLVFREPENGALNSNDSGYIALGLDEIYEKCEQTLDKFYEEALYDLDLRLKFEFGQIGLISHCCYYNKNNVDPSCVAGVEWQLEKLVF